MRGVTLGWVAILLTSAALIAGEDRQLTFEDRVAAQTAIKALYHSNQTGARRSFEQAVPRTFVEHEVRTYLEKSHALDRFWNTPVTAAALERELQRIARNTAFPDRLEHIYDALGRDAFVIQECLARPVLVDRLTRNFFAWDQRFHQAAGEEAVRIRDRLLSGELDPLAAHPSRTSVEIVGQQAPERPGEIGPIAERRDAFVIAVVLEEGAESFRLARYTVPKRSWDDWWSETSAGLEAPVAPVAARSVTLPAPAVRTAATEGTCPGGDAWVNGTLAGNTPGERTDHTAVWTGTEMIVWGGDRLGTIDASDAGGRYDPLTDTWTPISTASAPAVRKLHTAIWTGDEMIVWGGVFGTTQLNSGSRYDPLTDTWSPMSGSGAPTPRSRHTAIWTGSEMIVWGGLDGSGGQYDPVGDSWSPTSNVDAPSARFDHLAVWTGSEMIVWGSASSGDGGRYDPLTHRWTPTSTDGIPAGPHQTFSGVWTGSEMLVWATGGSGRYDPATDSWAPLSTTDEPSTRTGQSAVWTGSEMILWSGGYPIGGDIDIEVSTGARYDPVTDSWAPTATLNAPKGRFRHTAVWTGELMIAWGGDLGITVAGCCAGYESSGGRYDPASDSWTRTSSNYGSRGHTAIWTGNRMVVWGGLVGRVPTDVGGRYDPVTDSWSATSTIGAPASRTYHTAVWTGDEMIVWGGNSSAYHDTGGLYDPLTDSWTSTSTVGAPAPRSFHTAVWTGDEMIVWGGDDPPDYSPFSSGGRYEPSTDSWTETSLTGAPVGRLGHTAVWTGDRMVIWGGVDTPFQPNTPYDTGGRYYPVSNSWTATSSIGKPVARHDHSAVWTGNQMIVWGGLDTGSNPMGSGGRYNAVFDTWTSTSPAPVQRSGHTAVWTGDEMIVWGGYGSGFKGGRYTPANHGWATLSTTDEPRAHEFQTAVWTGELMLVWGTGASGGGAGGRYLPVTSEDADADTWCSIEDCNDADDGVWATPGEVQDLVFTGPQTLSWSAPSEPGGTLVEYDTLRSESPSDFITAPTCVDPDTTATQVDDTDEPGGGGVFYYLVRAENSCPLGLGSLGVGSDGGSRPALDCP